MSWFFSVALPTDPSLCHDAAGTLRSAARAAERTAAFLAGQSSMPGAVFSGLAAQSYRSASAALAADSRGVALDLTELAAALDDYAARIAGVRHTLLRVRQDAELQGFSISPDDRVQSVPVPGTAVEAAFQRLEDRAVAAQTEAESARSAWWQTVQAATTGPLASPASDPPPVLIHLPPVRPIRADPVEPAAPPCQPVREEPVPSTQPVPTQPVPEHPAPDPPVERPRSDPAPRKVAASVAPLPSPLRPVPDPAAHAPYPNGFEGVLA